MPREVDSCSLTADLLLDTAFRLVKSLVKFVLLIISFYLYAFILFSLCNCVLLLNIFNGICSIVYRYICISSFQLLEIFVTKWSEYTVFDQGPISRSCYAQKFAEPENVLLSKQGLLAKIHCTVYQYSVFLP